MPPASALAALVVLAMSAPASARVDPPLSVTILYEITAGHSAAALEEMKRQTAEILRDTGRSFAFHPLSGALSEGAFETLIVVRFRGACRMDAIGFPRRDERPLAFTHTSDGEVLPFAEVSCDALRAFVQPAVLARRDIPAEVLYGRALARVLAHELYHILARTERHGSHGLARTALTADQLIGDRLDLHPKDVHRVVAAAYN